MAMKMLAIGYPLPNMAIDNYNPLNAPSYFDYDALFIDPASCTRAAAELALEGAAFEAFDGRPVVNAPSTATAVSASDQLRRRADETQRLLEAGGVVIVMARPNATQSGVVGFEGCDRYSWLPAPAGVAWAPPFLRAAEGKTVRIAAEDHPLAGVLREFRREVAYRAVLDDRQPALRSAGRVFATGGAGTPIAMDFSLLGGRVVFIPAFTDTTGSFRSEVAQAIVDACQRMLGGASTGSAPHWARSLAVPGLEQVEAELEEAEASVAECNGRLAAVRERHTALADHRRVLFEDGERFVAAVVDALRLLGFAVTSQPGEPLVVDSGEERALVEVESAREAVVEWPYVRLQRRLEERMLSAGEQLKGIVIANGHRLTAPEERNQQFTDPLRIACENYRYTLLTGQSLFALVQRALGGADPVTLEGFRRRILRGSGLLGPESALGELEQGTDAGSIF